MGIPIPQPLERLCAWFRRQSRVTIDLIVIGSAVLAGWLLAVWYQALDRLFDLSAEHANHALDWLILLIIFVGIGAKIFSIRRVFDLRNEVRDRRAAQAKADRLAHEDSLTGLANRRHLLECFGEWTANLDPEEACTLFVIDLDDFKPVNDLYGHRFGDEVLRVVGARLCEMVGDNGMVARLGGDEFGVMLRSPRESDLPNRLAKRIVALASLLLEVGVSVGAATYDPAHFHSDDMAHRDGSDVETALRRADMAMYLAKSDGSGRYRFYDREMDEKLRERVQLEREIKGAIAAGQIVPYYQPLVDLASMDVTGYEILARWEHPERGVVMPEIFVPIAEATGTISEMTCSLLRRATEDAADWPQNTTLSLNLSAKQLSDKWLAKKLLGVMTEKGFAPKRLEVEVTEPAIMERIEDAKSLLQSLRNIGVKVALDHLGTGLSGLYHLRDLPLDRVKINRSFTARMLESTEETKIVAAIVRLCRVLGLQTTAEGIETQEVLDRLAALGCESGQGFLLGKPEPEPVYRHDIDRRNIA